MTTVIRPMLKISRSAVRSYLDARELPYREDSSNQSLCFTRNALRCQVIPQLAQEFNPQIVQALTRLGALAGEAQQVIDSVVAPLFESAVRRRGNNHVDVSCAPLRSHAPYVVREVLTCIWRRQGWPRQDMSELKWRELGNLVQLPTPSPQTLTLPGPVLARRVDDGVELRHLGSP
jgi:tRNA(Ile)-lysidine synthase